MNLKEKIEKMLDSNKELDSLNLSEELKIPEYEVLQNMPYEYAKAVDADKFDEIINEVTTWGELLFVKITPSFVIEVKAKIPKGSYGHGYYNFNMKDSPIGGHLKASDIDKIIFISKKHMGMLSHSIQFFNEKGEHIFKLFLTRNNKREILPEQLELYNNLKSKI